MTSFLTKCEKILFTGSYDINNRFIVSDATTTTTTLVMNISINPMGYNPRINVLNPVQDSQLPPTSLLNETMTISSYSSDQKTPFGMIQFTNFYPNEGILTTSPLISYDTTTKSGIYAHVLRVVIDFSKDVRLVYFIGRRG